MTTAQRGPTRPASDPTGRPPSDRPADSPIVGNTPKSTAVRLHAAGLWPIPLYERGSAIPGRDKKAEGKEPIGKAWGLERNTPDTLNATFKRHPHAGVGVGLGPGRGPGGGWLIDVEGDGPEAEESRARLYGGEDVKTLGWGKHRGGHQLLHVDPARMGELLAPLKGFEDKGLKAGVYHLPEFPGLEIRVGGVKPDGAVKQIQSAFPPTLGTDGKPRRWNGVSTIAPAPESFYEALGRAGSKPAPSTELLRALASEGRPVKGEPPPAKGPTPGKAHRRSPGRLDVEGRAAKYLASCQPAVSGQGGSGQTLKVAVEVGPGFDLPEDVAYRLLSTEYNPRCEPPWSEPELRHKVDDAYRVETRRGWHLNGDGRNGSGGNGRVGTLPPPSAPPPSNVTVDIAEPIRPNEAADDPHRLARVVLRKFTHADGPTLAHFRESFHVWEGTCYKADPHFISVTLVNEVKAELDRQNLIAIEAWRREVSGSVLAGTPGRTPGSPVARKVTRVLVANVAQALAAMTSVDRDPEPPFWIHPQAGDPDPLTLVPRGTPWSSFRGIPPSVCPTRPVSFLPTPCPTITSPTPRRRRSG